jgi:hypothetical protein
MALGPDGVESYEPALARGFAARTDGLRRDDFETFGSVTVHLTDDVKGWVDARRPFIATYVGGMGSATHNYHVAGMARRGFADEAARIQELFLAGRREEAIATMPDEYVLQNALIGSPARIREVWERGETVPPGVTGLVVGADRPEELDLIAELAGTREQELL